MYRTRIDRAGDVRKLPETRWTVDDRQGSSDPDVPRAGGAGIRLWAAWVTCVVDGLDHAVTDEDMCAGMTEGLGRYAALCDDEVTPAALTAPPGRTCPRCATVLHLRTGRAPSDRSATRTLRRPGLLARMVGRRECA
jgi:hypothetical protein